MYRIVLKKPAKKFIDRLPLNEKRRIVAAIERLPNGEDIKRLKGYDGLFRLRVGDYRIPVHGRPWETYRVCGRRWKQRRNL